MAVLDDLKGGGAHTMINEDKIQINKMQKPLKRCGVKGEVKSQLLECLKGSQLKYRLNIIHIHIQARVLFPFVHLVFNFQMFNSLHCRSCDESFSTHSYFLDLKRLTRCSLSS